MERYISIDNVCAWPNLTLMPNGEIIATIFNQPCHGRWQGEVECWASGDGGRQWEYRGNPTPPDPGTNRMNVAAGLAESDDLLVIASGWSNRPTREQVEQGAATSFGESRVLQAWVSRSSDCGRTWSITKSFPAAPESGMTEAIPFGDVLPAADGSLCVSAYSGRAGEPGERHNSNYFFRSRDDGLTWGEATFIDQGSHNETAPLHLGDGRWLAAARGIPPAQGVDMFASEDDGLTWQSQGPVSLPHQHPAHLLRLADGRILLVYGNRARGMWGIDARVSADEGQTWSTPVKLIELAQADLGYPSSAQTADGEIVTAYYLGQSREHHRYHMGVQVWKPEEFFPL